MTDSTVLDKSPTGELYNRKITEVQWLEYMALKHLSRCSRQLNSQFPVEKDEHGLRSFTLAAAQEHVIGQLHAMLKPAIKQVVTDHPDDENLYVIDTSFMMIVPDKQMDEAMGAFIRREMKSKADE